MGDSATLGRLLSIGAVRGLRLQRKLNDARAAIADASTKAAASTALHREAEIALDAARAMFAADPSCAQGRLWRDHARRLRQDAQARESVARARLEDAEATGAEAAAASIRHAHKGEALDDVHRWAVRIERRHAESRAEVDAERAGNRR